MVAAIIKGTLPGATATLSKRWILQVSTLRAAIACSFGPYKGQEGACLIPSQAILSPDLSFLDRFCIRVLPADSIWREHYFNFSSTGLTHFAFILCPFEILSQVVSIARVSINGYPPGVPGTPIYPSLILATENSQPETSKGRTEGCASGVNLGVMEEIGIMGVKVNPVNLKLIFISGLITDVSVEKKDVNRFIGGLDLDRYEKIICEGVVVYNNINTQGGKGGK